MLSCFSSLQSKQTLSSSDTLVTVYDPGQYTVVIQQTTSVEWRACMETLVWLSVTGGITLCNKIWRRAPPNKILQVSLFSVLGFLEICLLLDFMGSDFQLLFGYFCLTVLHFGSPLLNPVKVSECWQWYITANHRYVDTVPFFKFLWLRCVYARVRLTYRNHFVSGWRRLDSFHQHTNTSINVPRLLENTQRCHTCECCNAQSQTAVTDLAFSSVTPPPLFSLWYVW